MRIWKNRLGRAVAAPVLALTLCLAPAVNGNAADKEVFQSPDLPPGLPFSPAVRAGGMIYLSGSLGIMPGERKLVPGGIGPETEQALTYLQENLERAGSTLDRVVKCTVFLADIADFSAMNAEYRKFFPTDPPARSTVAVAALALGARTEIECIALAGDH